MCLNPLNSKDVDGNTMAWMADQDRERKDDGDAPELLCGNCGDPITDKESKEYFELCSDCYDNEQRGMKYGKI